ncbi:hypothetical protein YQE_03901, partial [Dendroctonus ponderosae]
MVQNIPIKPVKEVKYLRFKLDARLHFNKHVDHAIQKTLMARRKLYSLLVPNSFLSPRNKRLLYTSTIRPILTCGSPIWHSVYDSTYARITEMHEATRMAYIADYIDTIAAKFYHSGVQGSVLTRNITQVRANDRPTHVRDDKQTLPARCRGRMDLVIWLRLSAVNTTADSIKLKGRSKRGFWLPFRKTFSPY